MEQNCHFVFDVFVNVDILIDKLEFLKAELRTCLI